MKNKKLIYILLPLVIGIWITIIIKIFSFSNGSQNPINNNIINLQDTQVKQEVDTFIIIADYPDPFFRHGKNIKSNINPIAQDIKKKQKIEGEREKVKSVKWPQIDYGGLVNNNSKNQNIGFLKINNKDFLMKQGDTIEGIILEYIYKDSIQVNFKEDTRIIKKK